MNSLQKKEKKKKNEHNSKQNHTFFFFFFPLFNKHKSPNFMIFWAKQKAR